MCRCTIDRNVHKLLDLGRQTRPGPARPPGRLLTLVLALAPAVSERHSRELKVGYYDRKCKFNFSNHKSPIANYTCVYITLRMTLVPISWSTYACAFIHARLYLHTTIRARWPHRVPDPDIGAV